MYAPMVEDFSLRVGADNKSCTAPLGQSRICRTELLHLANHTTRQRRASLLPSQLMNVRAVLFVCAAMLRRQINSLQIAEQSSAAIVVERRPAQCLAETDSFGSRARHCSFVQTSV